MRLKLRPFQAVHSTPSFYAEQNVLLQDSGLAKLQIQRSRVNIPSLTPPTWHTERKKIVLDLIKFKLRTKQLPSAPGGE